MGLGHLQKILLLKKKNHFFFYPSLYLVARCCTRVLERIQTLELSVASPIGCFTLRHLRFPPMRKDQHKMLRVWNRSQNGSLSWCVPS